jgi:hypothetical protein
VTLLNLVQRLKIEAYHLKKNDLTISQIIPLGFYFYIALPNDLIRYF